MAQLIWGRKSQLQFNNDNDFYEALGFLAKGDGTTSLTWEFNKASGAWEDEGRIHCYKNLGKFGYYFRNAFTKGTGSIKHRINCNDYVLFIYSAHAFIYGKTQNMYVIRRTVPVRYRTDFDRGYNL